MKNFFTKIYRKSHTFYFAALALNAPAGNTGNSININIPTTPIGGAGNRPFTLEELSNIIGFVGRFIVAVSPILLVIAIIWSGILYMRAGNSPEKVTQAKKWLGYAVVGGLIIFGVGVIINTVAAVITREFFCQVGFMGICIY